MTDPNKDLILVKYEDLFDLYSALEDATTAASTGDPNTVSKKAAEAKRMVLDIHKEHRENQPEVQYVGVGNGDYQVIDEDTENPFDNPANEGAQL